MTTSSFQSQLNIIKKEDVQELRKERDHLMEKLGDMEAEIIASRINETKLKDRLKELQETKADLESQMQIALGQKSELSRLRDIKFLIEDSNNSQNERNRPKIEERDIQSTFQPIPIKSHNIHNKIASEQNHMMFSHTKSTVKQMKDEINTIGRLDGLLSNPNSKLNKIRVPDSKKIAAILLETNIIELQRHLLTITIQNQVSSK